MIMHYIFPIPIHVYRKRQCKPSELCAYMHVDLERDAICDMTHLPMCILVTDSSICMSRWFMCSFMFGTRHIHNSVLCAMKFYRMCQNMFIHISVLCCILPLLMYVYIERECTHPNVCVFICTIYTRILERLNLWHDLFIYLCFCDALEACTCMMSNQPFFSSYLRHSTSIHICHMMIYVCDVMIRWLSHTFRTGSKVLWIHTYEIAWYIHIFRER